MMVEYQDIQEAYNRIKDYINKTPILTSRSINEILNTQVWFKCENFQKVGAFKFRGAMNALRQLSAEEKQKGVITHSSGNHAQALALAAKMLGIPATIIMPKNSPIVKYNATKTTYQAKVVLCENSVESRQETCNSIRLKEGQTLIHPYDNDNIIAGAGTAALELLTAQPNLEIIMTPVGGGGLLSGTSIVAKAINPNIKVIAGEPEKANDAYRSVISGEIRVNKSANTIADGLRTNLCNRTFRIIQKHVDEIITVPEELILKAMRLVWERMKIIIEPSSAVPIAAILYKPEIFTNKHVGIILSGGNVDVSAQFDYLYKLIT